MAADLSSSEEETLSTILQGIQRDINCLSEENKAMRKRAIDKIHKELLKQKPPLSANVLQEILEKTLKPILKLFSDPSEKCRELSIQFIMDASTQVTNMAAFLPYIIPMCVQRLGQQDIVESCEELRLLTVELLTALVDRCKEAMNVYIDDMIQILKRTIADPFHHVKKESCRCTCLLAKTIPEQFYYQAESLVKPLLLSITHQHSKVRVSVLETIGVVIQGGDGKNVDSVLPHVAQRTFDDNASVRAVVSTVVGGWLLDLRDRYSYFHKLIPLLMTGLSDDMDDIQKKSWDLFEKVGKQYEEENEQDFKDEQDFQFLDRNITSEGRVRPCLGCRVLVERNLSKILPAILRDMTDWTVPTRVKAVSLLYHMLYYAEDNATQHMEALLSGLYKGCRDEDATVVNKVTASAELVGRFVEPAVYLKLCLPHLRSASTSSPAQCASVLRILAAMIKGTLVEKARPNLKVVCEAIVNPDVCDSETVAIQEQLLNLVDEIAHKSGEQCEEYSLELFLVVLHVLALQKERRFDENVEDCLSNIAGCLQLQSSKDIYKRHSKDVLERLKKTHESWTSHSSARLLFTTLLLQAGPVVGTLLEDIVPMFTVCLNPEKDPELRLKFFSLLSKLSMDSRNTINSAGEFPTYSGTIVVECVIPNLVWRAGRVAIAIRTAAVSTLWALLHANLLSVEKCNATLKDLLTHIVSCLDDHSSTTRLISCQVLEKLLSLCKDSFHVDLLHTLYPELLKRMDDSNDEIRLCVTKTILAFFKAFPQNYDKDLYKLHLEAMFKGLLVHLDDPSSHIQEGVLYSLKEGSRICPSILRDQVVVVQHKHRVSRYCDDLLKHIDMIRNKSQHKNEATTS